MGEIPLDELMAAQQPAILKGVVRDWPLVRAGLDSPASAIAYLKSFYRGTPVIGFAGRPEIKGRFFYNEDVTGMNFDAGRVLLDEVLDRIAAQRDDEEAPSFYVGSTDLDTYLPGLRDENYLPLDDAAFGGNPPIVSIWIGNRTTASAHYDMSNNMACCMVGRRRFSLFPPEQVHNLYPGPLEPTPGGQVVSMVDFGAPDLDRYPRFLEALEAGQVAELEPGDLLFYPALWWHQVEALDGFNAMINYWWNTSPAFMDSPQNTLLHALLSLRDRPEPEKRAWRALFDYYVFGPADRAGAHLPEAARGNLAPLDETRARRLRASLLNRLNR
ncbi:MAG: cupin-like protein [Sphingomonas bacterium]|nr:cupin-like protein [Sphingomonas bacterium]